MDTKINFTIYDILTHLVPGAALLILLQYIFDIQIVVPSEQYLFAITVFGYITGIFLHIFSGGLYYYFDVKGKPKKLIDFFLIKKISEVHRELYNEIDSCMKREVKLNIPKVDDPQTQNKEIRRQYNLLRFTFCDMISNLEPSSDRAILLAKEGLIKSLTVFILIICACALYRFTDYWFYISILWIVLTQTLIWKRHQFYVLRMQHIYMLTLLRCNKK